MTVLRLGAMLWMLVLSACGGGGDSQAPVPSQQYVDGIWEGKLGTSNAFAIMVANADGTGTDTLIGKSVSANYAYASLSPYDLMQGRLNINKNVVFATDLIYQGIQAFNADTGYLAGDFTNAVKLSGVALQGPGVTQADRLSGTYSQPVFPSLPDGDITYTLQPITLSLSDQNKYTASIDAVRGTYRGGSIGSIWSITINNGFIAGSVSGCMVVGGVKLKTPSTNASSKALYEVNMTLRGISPRCTRSGVTYEGLAYVTYNAANQKTGLRFIQNSQTVTTAQKPSAHLVLDGTFMADIQPLPVAITPVPQGFYVDAANNLYAAVLPDNRYFFYKDSGLLLQGELGLNTNSSFVMSKSGSYFSPGVSDVYVVGDIQTTPAGLSFKGYYTYSPLDVDLNTPTFNLVLDPALPYVLPGVTTDTLNLTGTYSCRGGFSCGQAASLTLGAKANNSYPLSATPTPGCNLTGQVTPYSTLGTGANTGLNLFSVSGLSNSCDIPAVSYSGVLFAEINANNVVTGLRLAATSTTTDTAGNALPVARFFLGTKQ
jgi:hypothetical protein